MKLFLQKNANFSSTGGSSRRPPCLRRLGVLPPNPQPPAAGGFAPRPPLASGGWGLRPQTPQTAPPIVNFWLRAWLQPSVFLEKYSFWEVLLKQLATIIRVMETGGDIPSNSSCARQGWQYGTIQYASIFCEEVRHAETVRLLCNGTSTLR